MSRSRYGHNVNASLIREVRMIAQQFFQTKRHQQFFGGGETVGRASKMLCVFCLHINTRKAQEAITVMNGQAVCHDHSYYVQGGEFNRILAIIRNDVAGRKR